MSFLDSKLVVIKYLSRKGQLKSYFPIESSTWSLVAEKQPFYGASHIRRSQYHNRNATTQEKLTVHDEGAANKDVVDGNKKKVVTPIAIANVTMSNFSQKHRKF